MSNYNESDFSTRIKRFFSNRAVIVTLVTLLAAVGVVIAVTVSANRARQNAPGGMDTVVSGVNGTTSNPANLGEQTLPVYHGQESQPVNADPDDPAGIMSLPVSGKLFKDHDATLQVYSATMGDYRVHLGIDIATDVNAPVYAAADGTVEQVWDDALMGTCVAIQHDGDTVSVYKNLAKELAEGIEVGASVTGGQQIGAVGDTAMLEMADEPHLHFEMTVNGLSVDPLDYFSREAVATLSRDTAYEDSAVTTAAGK